MKTSLLTGQALDWVVAKCEGRLDNPKDWLYGKTNTQGYTPSSEWDRGGPIIERERITIQFDGDGVNTDLTDREGRFYQAHHEASPLIAAMRCYVASKLGEEIDIPKEVQNVTTRE